MSQTVPDFQTTLQAHMAALQATGHELSTRRLTGINCEPANAIGQTLLQAKEFLTSAQYEQMLDTLAFNPLDAAYFIERLKTSTQYAIQHDLEQAFHLERMDLIRGWKSANSADMPHEERARLVLEFLENLMALAKRQDEQTPVIIPREFTRDELYAVHTHGSPLDTMLNNLTGQAALSIEARVEYDLQEQAKRRAEATSGVFYQRLMVEFINDIKDVLTGRYTPEDEEEDEEEEAS